VEILQQLFHQTKVSKTLDLEERTNLTATISTPGNLHKCFVSKLIDDDWIVDTGASNHMIGVLQKLIDYKQCDKSVKVIMAEGTISDAKGEGLIYLNDLWLKSVLFVLCPT